MRVGPLKKDPHGRGGRGRGMGGDARFVMFYEGLRFWEARFVVFYEGLKLWEARFGRRQISSDYVLRSIDGRHMDVAAAIETFVTNKAGDAGSSCKVKHFACAYSWSRESLRHSL